MHTVRSRHTLWAETMEPCVSSKAVEAICIKAAGNMCLCLEIPLTPLSLFSATTNSLYITWIWPRWGSFWGSDQDALRMLCNPHNHHTHRHQWNQWELPPGQRVSPKWFVCDFIFRVKDFITDSWNVSKWNDSSDLTFSLQRTVGWRLEISSCRELCQRWRHTSCFKDISFTLGFIISTCWRTFSAASLNDTGASF